MSTEYAYSFIYNFLITHQLISLCIAIALILFLWKKPKEFFRFTLFILAMALIFYIATFLNESMIGGIGNKHQMINETEEIMTKEQVSP